MDLNCQKQPLWIWACQHIFAVFFLSNRQTMRTQWVEVLFLKEYFLNDMPLPFQKLKVAFFQKLRCVFHIAKINIPNHLKLKIWISRPGQEPTYSDFKLRIVIWNIDFGNVKNTSHFLKKHEFIELHFLPFFWTSWCVSIGCQTKHLLSSFFCYSNLGSVCHKVESKRDIFW